MKWTGSIGKNDKIDKNDGDIVRLPESNNFYGQNQALQGQSTQMQLPQGQSTQMQLPQGQSPQGQSPIIKSPKDVMNNNMWSDFDDSGGDSPAAINKQKNTGKKVVEKQEGIEYQYVVCNSINAKDYGYVYYRSPGPGGAFQLKSKESPSTISKICASPFYNCGEQWCRKFKDPVTILGNGDQRPVGSGGEAPIGRGETPIGSGGAAPIGYKGEEQIGFPPVDTETTLTGQKGGDECIYTDDQIRQMRFDLAKAQRALVVVNDKLKSKGDECNEIQRKELRNQEYNFKGVQMRCGDDVKILGNARLRLKNIPKGTIQYSRQLDYVAELQALYNSCKRKNTIKTEYNRMFITQMYDSNEYEGDISVFDKDWNKDDELIHDCKNNKLA
jgi:hypothetical protein